jgi:alpha-galactosidase
MTKITCLGAGSHSFGLSTLITLLQSEVLRGAEIVLVDTNQESLDLITQLANWLNSEWDSGKLISSHSSHQNALKGSDFVISAIEVQPRERLWRQDFELGSQFGLRQPYAENGGPGGFAHAARNVNTILKIAHDMEVQCPDAWYLNFSNPLHRICYLINEYSSIKSVGLCHQLGIGYAMVAKALAADYAIEGAETLVSSHADPKNADSHLRMSLAGMQHFKITAAGLNHFTWMIGLQDRNTGEDLYPLFRKRWESLSADFEPLTQKVFAVFDLFPIPGDEHLCEYLPWMSSSRTRPWQKYDLSLYDWNYFEANREDLWKQVAQDIHFKQNIERYSHTHSEGAIEIIEAMLTDSNSLWEAVNIPNNGTISGLSKNAVVEFPAKVNRSGFTPLCQFDLPKGVLSLLQREVSTAQLGIDAVVQGDRQLALQSLLLDPVIDDLDVAEKVLDEILVANKMHLPQFF